MISIKIIFLFASLAIVNWVTAQTPRLLLPVVSNDYVENAIISPDQRFLIASSFNPAEVKVWDVRTKKLIYTIKDNYINPHSNCFSPDGKKLLTGDDVKFNIWNIQDGQLLLRIAEKTTGGMASFSHKGQFLLTSSGGSITVRNAETGDPDFEIMTDHSSVYPIIITPDDHQVAFAYQDTISIWNLQTRQLTTQYAAAPHLKKKGFNNEVETNLLEKLAFTGNGKQLVSLYFDSSLCIYDLKSRNIFKLPFKTGDFSLDESGNKIALIGDGKLNIISLESFQNVLSYPLSETYGSMATLNKDGQYYLLTGFSNSNEIKCGIHPVNGGPSIDSLFAGSDLSFHPSFQLMDSFIVYKDINKGIRVQRWKEHRIQTAPDLYSWQSQYTSYIPLPGSPILLAQSDTLVQVIDLQKAQIKDTYSIPGGLITSKSAFAIKQSNDYDGKIPDTIISMVPVTGKVIRQILLKNAKGKAFATNSGKHLIIDGGIMSNELYLVDAQIGKLVRTIQKEGGNPIEEAWFLEKSGLIVSTNQVITLSTEIYNSKTGRLHMIARNYPDEEYDYSNGIHLITYSASNRYLAILSTNRLSIWDLVTRQKIKQLDNPEEAFAVAAFSPDEQTLAFGTDKGNISILDLQGFKLIKKITGHQSYISYLEFSADGQYLLSAESNGIARYTAINTGKNISTITAPTGNSIIHSDFQNKRLWCSDGSILSVFGLENGKALFSLACAGAGAFIFMSPESYYLASPEISKKLAWTIDRQICSFSQLDIQFNRPDKILQQLSSIFGNTDSSLQISYRKAWEKRRKKLDITEDQKSIPEAVIINRDTFTYEIGVSQISLHIVGKDSLTTLKRLNIWINEIPVFGIHGLPINIKPGYSLDTSLNIRLSDGENIIEASVTNTSGIESYRIPFLLNYTPAVPRKQITHFIGIGIDRFAQPNHNLQYCSKDIRDLAKRFKELYGEKIRIDTLFNEAVTVDNIKALKQKILQTDINDQVIISYSGHGLLSNNYDYYLSSYNVNFDQPEENGLAYDELENLLDGIPARKKLLLLDACHSGEVDKDEMFRISAASNSLNQQGTKGGKPTYTGKTTLGMKNSFELMQSLFVNVGRSTGATIIAAAAGTQFAREEGKLQNGVFTFSLLEAIDKYPRMNVSQLKTIISQRVVQLTNGLQQPTSRSENQAVDWRVW